MTQTINITKRNGETISFQTAHSFETAIQAIEKMIRDNSFADSLWQAFSRYGNLSPKQEAWMFKLAEERTPTIEAAPTTPQPKLDTNYSGIVNWLKATGLKTPKITLSTDDGKLKLNLAGSRSKNPGTVYITDGGPFGDNEYYGAITPDGQPRFTRNMTAWVRSYINQWNDNPASILDTARAHGHKTGNCCFCSRDLTTRESVTVGYGPVCAEKYGLPWGEVVERDMTEIVTSPAMVEAMAEFNNETPEERNEKRLADPQVKQAQADRAGRPERQGGTYTAMMVDGVELDIDEIPVTTPLTELNEFFC